MAEAFARQELLAFRGVDGGFVQRAVDVETVGLEAPFVGYNVCRQERRFDVFCEPHVGEHGDGGGLGADLRNGGKLLHVGDAVDDGVDFAAEDVAMRELAAGTANFRFPAGIENVCDMLLGLSGQRGEGEVMSVPAHGRIWSAWCRTRHEVSFISPKRAFRTKGGSVHMADER